MKKQIGLPDRYHVVPIWTLNPSHVHPKYFCNELRPNHFS